MARLIVFAPFLLALLAIQWRCAHSFCQPKVTNLHFFFHDIVTGNDPSAVLVAAPLKNLTGVQQGFGNVMVIDDPLTEGPELDSNVVGAAQGFYIVTGRKTPMLTLGADYGFTAGPYNGSSFSVFSQNPVMETERELAVVGGRGAFRMAQGFAKLRTISISNEGDAVVEYNPKVTNLHFFFHDIVTGNDPSAVLVAAPLKNLTGVQQGFGNMMVIDDPLTEGPELDSNVVGAAQGFYIVTGRKTPMLTLGADYGFTAGPYNGSSFSVFSQNPVMETERELAVVGGRGAFRMAQGFAKLRTISISNEGDAVVEYNVTLYHY
ncbi:Plant disease resistance response protein [Canna indica]|uniref:Dirigent protein n=1 Tax=Canna indica TaxID=4628 RepID=A0AAQ3KJJ9_9LILI|nr:Plant disease resistance response protein [Canna indica]